jgi:hypothetical protein
MLFVIFITNVIIYDYNTALTFKDETYLCYIRIQSVPSSKHFPLRL